MERSTSRSERGGILYSLVAEPCGHDSRAVLDAVDCLDQYADLAVTLFLQLRVVDLSQGFVLGCCDGFRIADECGADLES